MAILWNLGVGLGCALLFVLVVLVARPRSRALRFDTIAGSVGLPPAPEFAPVVRAAVGREARGALAGVTVGLVAACLGLAVERIDDPSQIVWTYFTAIVATGGLGIAVATTAAEHARQGSAVRVARLRAVTPADYRSPFDRWLPRIVVLLALAGLLLRLTLSPRGEGGIPILFSTYALLMVAALAIGEVAALVLVRTGQPAGSELELAWDDALKSRALRSIFVAPLYMGGYFGLAAGVFYPAAEGSAGALATQAESIVSIIGVVLVLAWVVAGSTTSATRWYLRRLWPDLAATDPEPSESARTGADRS